MRIVLLEPLGIAKEILKKHAGKLKEKGHELVIYNDHVHSTQELIKRAEDAEILIIANMPLSGEVINACPKLKMISVAFTGIDHIDLEACKERGITVCNAAGYSTHSVAELVFGQIISLLRNTSECDKATRDGKTKAGLIGNELYGKTLGIIGTGAIGLRVAEIGKIFDYKLLAYSRTEKKEALDKGITYVDLDTLLSESDIVTIHAPYTKETEKMLNKEKIAKMKNSSILINTARGPIVDSTALYTALREKRIRGAAIDVFEMEPPLPKEHPLLKAPNALVTPHIGFATGEAFIKRAQIVFENILKWQEGRPQNVKL